MALNDNAVVSAAQGFLYIAPVGTARPTPDELDVFDSDTWGTEKTVVVVTGTPTSYTLTVTVGLDDQETTALPLASNAATVQAALEALSNVGSGNVEVTGTSAVSPGLTINFVGDLAEEDVDVTEGTYVGGTSPDTTITETAANGWLNVGHTSRDDMPEFGFDGGDTEVKGTWQKKRLREIATGDPVADSVTMMLQQIDEQALELYYGANAGSTDGVFDVDGNFVPVEYALLIVVVDGENNVGFHASKASFKRDDSIEMPVDEFIGFPVKATFLNHSTRPLYSWISKGLISPAA
jgi:hypothetical protein